MRGLAAVFIALSLLLSPLTVDRNGANNSDSGDGAMTLRQQAEHSESGYHANGPMVSSTEVGGMSAITTEDKDNSDCPIKYPDPNSKAYCECVVDRTDNFVCNVRVPRLVISTRIELTLVVVGSTIARAPWGGSCAPRLAAVRTPPSQPQPPLLPSPPPKL